MSDYVSLGKRKNDFGLAIDFHKKRAIVRANTGWIAEGIPLEDIPQGPNDYCPAMVLIDRNWKRLYFVIERKGWTDEQYFRLADDLMIKQGISRP